MEKQITCPVCFSENRCFEDTQVAEDSKEESLVRICVLIVDTHLIHHIHGTL